MYKGKIRFILSFLTISILIICNSDLLKAQVSNGGVGALFLSMPPSPISNGIGGAGVALDLGDPYSFHHNPSILGFSGVRNHIAVATYPGAMQILPGFSDDYNLYNLAVSGGYNFLSSDSTLPLSIGTAFMFTNMNLGEFVRTDETGQVIGRFESWESAQTFAIGAMYDMGVKIGTGFAIKSVRSKLAGSSMSYNLINPATAIAFDFGLLVQVPVFSDVKITENMNFDLAVSAGFSLLNMGEDLDYQYEKDPLPRSSSLGYSVNTGFDYNIKGKEFKALLLDWSVEANDLMVDRDSLGFEYQAILSDMDMFDNIILLNENNLIEVKYGFRISMMEMFRMYYGWNYYNQGEGFYNSGFSIHSSGIFKLMSVLTGSPTFDFIGSHFDLNYSTSNVEPSDSGSPLATGVDYSSIGIKYLF